MKVLRLVFFPSHSLSFYHGATSPWRRDNGQTKNEKKVPENRAEHFCVNILSSKSHQNRLCVAPVSTPWFFRFRCVRHTTERTQDRMPEQLPQFGWISSCFLLRRWARMENCSVAIWWCFANRRNDRLLLIVSYHAAINRRRRTKEAKNNYCLIEKSRVRACVCSASFIGGMAGVD